LATAGQTYILISSEASGGQIAVVLEAGEKNLREVEGLLKR
jgi:hypothetical protein